MLRVVLPCWGGTHQESLQSVLLLVLYYANLSFFSTLYQLLPQLQPVSDFLCGFLSSLGLDLNSCVSLDITTVF